MNRGDLIHMGLSVRPAKGTPCKHYVYALIDPRDRSVFYVGKGIRKRYAAHQSEWERGKLKCNPEKFIRIQEINDAGFTPEPVFLATELSEPDALKLERALIEAHRDELTNVSGGTLPERERTKLEARVLLGQIKPYDVWLAERPRSASDCAMHRSIVAECEKIARDGWESRLVVEHTVL